ncbi:MATE family efflux transporter [Pseudoduganella plicata]|uniref:MATE family efflux transporter n=1 Tax=Pseudoduganella plicata TaxID=321984 RepID=A0A4P7BEU2_9BURK|nr:MATE family efflux transporter [Pseudoduganella plicata]QBQ37164.1 MATE family efflux transporter [Pseudoduganella plicata]GGY98828.1 hypothetical protein GCM10007388_35550 [Pseudoduganella plicata]
MTNIDFTADDVRKSLFRFSVPMMLFSILDYIGMFIALGWLLTLTDLQQLPATFRIAVASVSLLEALFSGLLSAIYVYANQAFGKKDFPLSNYLLNFGFGVTVLIALVIAVTGRFCTQYLISAFGVDPLVKQQVLSYLNVYWFGYLFVIVHLYVGLLARMAGAVWVIRRFKIVTFGTSVLLCPTFIHFGAQLGVEPLQAAAAALIAARVAGLLVLRHDMVQRKVFPFRLGIDFVPRKLFTRWAELVKLGGAETLNSFSLSLSFYLLYLLFSFYEPGTLEAVTVTQYVTGFFQTVLMGAIGTIIPFTAQNAGGRKLANIGTGVRWMASRTFILAALPMIPFILLAPYFIHFFVSDPDIAARAISYVRITSIPWAVLMASFPFLFAIIGLGDTRGTLLLTIWSMYLCNLVPVIVIRMAFGGSLTLAAYAESVSHVAIFVGFYLYYLRKEKQLAREWNAEQAAELKAQGTDGKLAASGAL